MTVSLKFSSTLSSVGHVDCIRCYDRMLHKRRCFNSLQHHRHRSIAHIFNFAILCYRHFNTYILLSHFNLHDLNFISNLHLEYKMNVQHQCKSLIFIFVLLIIGEARIWNLQICFLG